MSEYKTTPINLNVVFWSEDQVIWVGCVGLDFFMTVFQIKGQCSCAKCPDGDFTASIDLIKQ